MKAMILKIILIALPLCVIAFIYFGTVPPARSKIIKSNYFELREDFLRNAQKHGATITSLPVKARSNDNKELFIDIAWFGSPSPETALLHISGTHGVEGYAGSAIQTTILTEAPTLAQNKAVIFIHGLNPWGMANFRRFNEANSDLNRNFLLDKTQFKGAPEGYRLIEEFLNPPGEPSRIDSFYPGAAYNVLRHGFNALKQAIAGGQYEYPKGIYYGGSEMEESNRILRDFVTQRLSGVKKLYTIEIHTGLGDWGKDVLFWPLSLKDPKSQNFSKQLEETLSTDAPDEGVGFRTPGDLQNEVPKLMPNTENYWLLQEFGAYGPVKTLRALRDENRYHQSGGKDLNHWSKQMLLEAFSPGDEGWQRTVVDRGVILFKKVLNIVNQN